MFPGLPKYDPIQGAVPDAKVACERSLVDGACGSTSPDFSDDVFSQSSPSILFAARHRFWVQVESMPIPARNAIRMEHGAIARTDSASAFCMHVGMIVSGRAEPEMSITRANDTIDCVCPDFVVSDASWDITCMERPEAIREWNSAGHLKRKAMRSDAASPLSPENAITSSNGCTGTTPKPVLAVPINL